MASDFFLHPVCVSAGWFPCERLKLAKQSVVANVYRAATARGRADAAARRNRVAPLIGRLAFTDGPLSGRRCARAYASLTKELTAALASYAGRLSLVSTHQCPAIMFPGPSAKKSGVSSLVFSSQRRRFNGEMETDGCATVRPRPPIMTRVVRVDTSPAAALLRALFFLATTMK